MSRILWITQCSPLPLMGGRQLRTFNLLKYAAMANEVTLVTSYRNAVEYQELDTLRKLCTNVVAFPYGALGSGRRELVSSFLKRKWQETQTTASSLLRKAVRELPSSQFDFVYIDGLNSMVCCDELSLPIVLDEHNVEWILAKRLFESRKQQSSSNFYTRLKNIVREQQVELLYQFEKQSLVASSLALAVSDLDADALKNMHNSANVRVVPNGVDTNYFSPQPVDPKSNTILFSGGLDWYPNADAVDYFCREIWPSILSVVPEAQFIVVGATADSALTEIWSKQGVNCVGSVADIRPYLAAAAVVAVPLRIGGGTRLKILDAMAMGKPIVSTSIGAEGLTVFDGENIVINDDPAAFADSIISLLRSHQKRKIMGQCARNLVETTYDWKIIGPYHNLVLSEIS